MKKLTIENTLICLTGMFPLTVFVQMYNNSLNRIVFIALVAALVFVFFSEALREGSTITAASVFLVLASIVISLYSYLITRSTLINFNDAFYLPFWTLYLCYFAKRHEYIEEYIGSHGKVFAYFVTLSTIVLLLFMATNRSYAYFGRHRLASGAFLLIVESLLLFQQTAEKKYLIPVFICSYTIFNSTSRTYLIMLLVLLILIYYRWLNNKVYFCISIIPLLVLFVFLVANSNMAQYFEYKQVGNFDALGSVTSGRTVFWEADLRLFQSGSTTEKLFGHGFNAVYYANASVIALIYAHNDFLNVILSTGMAGLSIYFSSFIYFLKTMYRYAHASITLMIVISLLFMFNAFFNGQYNYPAATVSMLYLYMYLKEGAHK